MLSGTVQAGSALLRTLFPACGRLSAVITAQPATRRLEAPTKACGTSDGILIPHASNLLGHALHSSATIPCSAVSASSFHRQREQGLRRSLHSSAACDGSPDTEAKPGRMWEMMIQQGHSVNPCKSKLHPAVVEAGLEVPEGEEELCVQEAYTPDSQCWGCGPAHPDGLNLRSFRAEQGLTARITLPSRYCAFPGIINGGVIAAAIDCHGNWTAAIALMDRHTTPKPPLTLTASMLVNYREPTPPDTELILRSKVVAIKEGTSLGAGRVSVEVDVDCYEIGTGPSEGQEKLLVSATGVFKKLGAARCL